MKIRPKLFLKIFGIAFAALLLLSLFSFWQRTQQVEVLVRDALNRDANWLALRFSNILNDRESSLANLAQNSVLRSYLRCHGSSPAKTIAEPAGGCNGQRQSKTLPADLAATITTFMQENRKSYGPISLLDSDAEPIVRGTVNQSTSTSPDATPAMTFQTEHLPKNNDGGPDSIGGDEGFIQARDATPLRELVERGPLGATVRYTVPVFSDSAEAGHPPVVLGALVIDFRLEHLFKEQAGDVIGLLNGAPTGMQTSRVVFVLRRGEQIYYHSHAPVTYQPVATAMPEFKDVASSMIGDESGTRFYEGSDGDQWLASYRPLGQHNLSIAVATDYTSALALGRTALFRNILFSLVIALIAALLLTLLAQQRSGQSLQRLTEDAAVIAGGRFDQQLVVSSAENQPLADSMNALTARLREQLAREAESRQFDAFMRLSAMLTHDLKNAIAGLSLLVGNMDRQFHVPEFRADAMSSLRDATAKLQRLVKKLSEPANTMSGEYQRPRPTDLVPLIQGVVDSVAGSQKHLHKIVVDLPAELIAETEAERIEKVVENLIINALEAMGSTKGVLTITGGNDGEGKVFFSVADTGPGMTREFQERRLFHPFATTKAGGVGLGLYTCREVVRAHGGSIDAISEPGVGTTFRVVLPSVHPI